MVITITVLLLVSLILLLISLSSLSLSSMLFECALCFIVAIVIAVFAIVVVIIIDVTMLRFKNVYNINCVSGYLSVTRYTANLPTNIADFRGFDSSIILLLMGGILRPIGNFPESLSQAMLVGTMLVGRSGVAPPTRPANNNNTNNNSSREIGRMNTPAASRPVCSPAAWRIRLPASNNNKKKKKNNNNNNNNSNNSKSNK